MSERFSREYSIEIECRSEGEPFQIGQQATHELTMVAREGLLNSVLHGSPKEIHTTLSFSAKKLDLRISDDGRGFDPAATPSEGHYGLEGVRERVHRFGGDVRIESKINFGTHLRVSVPREKLAE
jgi:signal transduction histidine kinase